MNNREKKSIIDAVMNMKGLDCSTDVYLVKDILESLPCFQETESCYDHDDQSLKSEWKILDENGMLLSYLEEDVDGVICDTLESIATKICLVSNCDNCPVVIHDVDERTEEEKENFVSCQSQLLNWIIKESKKRTDTHTHYSLLNKAVELKIMKS